MLKIITSLTALVVGLLANAQVSETRNVSPFTKIEITDGVELIYTQNDNTTLKVEATDGLGLSSLDTKSEDGILKVSCKGNGCERVSVFVTSPEIVSVKASRNARFTMTKPLHTSAFSATLASGSTFLGVVKSKGMATLKAKSGSVFNIRVESETVYGNFQSGAKVNLSGTAGYLAINTANNALCNARNFITDKVAVNAADHSSVLISAKNEVSLDVAENASVKYFGQPEKLLVNREAIASNASGTLIATEN